MEGINMLTHERQMEIFNYLKKNQSATTDELAKKFEISGSTVRRDLEALSEKKLIIRTHNGAVLNSPHAETSFAVAYNIMKKEKETIAIKALKLINNADFIALSGGSTAYILAKELVNSEIHELTVLTNSINIATMILESKKSFNLIMAGGVPRKGSYECIGEITTNIIEQFNIDKFFMGVNGIDIEGGISFSSIEEAQVSRAIFHQSMQTFIIADNSKFSVIKPARISDVTHPDGIITDKLPKKIEKDFIAKGAKIL